MFASYKKHNNELYNNLVKLSRNKFFYQEISLEDKTEIRIILIFFHFALILHVLKLRNLKIDTQDKFDNIFQNIEYNLREMGDGDVAVNKKMKNLTRIFYDILFNFDKSSSVLSDNNYIFLKKYFFKNIEIINANNLENLSKYFSKFKNFCFDLDAKNMLNGSFNFTNI